MFKKRILTGLSLFLVFFFTDKLFCLDIDYSVNNPQFEICFDNSIVFKTQYKDIQKNATQVEEGFLYNGQTFVDYSEIPEYKDEVQYVDNYYEAKKILK